MTWIQRWKSTTEKNYERKDGQVTLDDTYYPGQDLYSDGEIEDEMLEIAKTYSQDQWNEVIRPAQKLAYTLSFFSCAGKYFKLASFYRQRKRAGNRLRLQEPLQAPFAKRQSR